MNDCPLDNTNSRCLLRQLAAGEPVSVDPHQLCEECQCCVGDLQAQSGIADLASTADWAAFACDTSQTSDETLAHQDGDVRFPASFPTISGYVVTGRLGAGGMGVVWRATQQSTKREVALKTTQTSTLGSSRGAARFQREVELSARLDHPNIARVYESGKEDDLCYYALELIRGDQLDRYAAVHRYSDRQKLELMVKVCRGVEHAHQRGVIHRDLKPSNILVDESGEPHVLDFGLAKSILDEGHGDGPLMTRDGAITGTPAFMSPEQAAGRIGEIDTRTDVYALGVILYRVLINKTPHDLSGSQFEVLRRIVDDDVRRPRQVNPNINGEVEGILLKALARDPADRYGNAGELADDLQRYLRGDPVEAIAPTTFYYLRKAAVKHRLGIALAATALLLLIAATGFYIYSIEAERVKTRQQFSRAEKNAEKATQKAKEAEQNAQQARQKQLEAEAARALEARQTYWTTIKLVREQMRAGQFVGVGQTLWETQRDLRGWEWGYLMSRLPTERWMISAHEGAVLDVATSKDGAVIATVGGDGRCRLWRADTQALLWSHQEPRPISHVAISRDLKWVAGTTDVGVIILSARDGALAHRINNPNSHQVAFSHDDKHLVVKRTTAADKPELVSFRTSDWQVHAREKGYGTETLSVDNQGRFLATSGGSIPKQVRLTDMSGLKELKLFKATRTSPWAGDIAVDSERGVLLATDYQQVYFFDLADPNLESSRSWAWSEKPYIDRIAVDFSRSWIAVAKDDGHLGFFDWDGEQLGRAYHGSGISCLRSVAGQGFVSAGRRGSLKCWNPAELAPPPSSDSIWLSNYQPATEVEIDSAGNLALGGGTWFALGNQVEGQRSQGEMRSLRVKVHCGEMSNDGRAFISIDRTIGVFDPRQGARDGLIATLLAKGIISRIAVDPGGRTAVVALDRGGLQVLDARTGEELDAPSLSGNCIPLISRDGAVAAALSPDTQLITVWPVREFAAEGSAGETSRTIQGAAGKWQCGALHPQGLVLAAGDEYGGIHIYHLNENPSETDSTDMLEPAAAPRDDIQLIDHVGEVNCLEFSPDGTRLFSNSKDKTVRVWDWQLGRELLSLEGGGMWRALSLDPSGRRLAGTAEVVKLRTALPWDVQPGDPRFYAAVAARRREAKTHQAKRSAEKLETVFAPFPEWSDAHLASCLKRLKRWTEPTRDNRPWPIEALQLQRHLVRKRAEREERSDAQRLAESLLKRCEQERGTADSETLANRIDYATLLTIDGRFSDSLPLWESIAKQDPTALPASRPFTLCLSWDFQLHAQQQGAATQLTQVLTDLTKRWGAQRGEADTWTLTAIHNLGVVQLYLGDAGASQQFRRVEGPLKKSFGWTHPVTLASRHNLAYAFQAQNNVQPTQLLSTCESVRNIRQHMPKSGQAEAWTSLAEAYLVNDDVEQARAALDTAVSITQSLPKAAPNRQLAIYQQLLSEHLRGEPTELSPALKQLIDDCPFLAIRAANRSQWAKSEETDEAR